MYKEHLQSIWRANSHKKWRANKQKKIFNLISNKENTRENSEIIFSCINLTILFYGNVPCRESYREINISTQD